jgi:hypothetical protein
MRQTIYDDGVYRVTTAVVSTPHRFYPIANTTASIRRDPLWAGIGVAGFSMACLAVYGDLLRPIEINILLGVTAVAVVLGCDLAILRIHSIGHARTMIFGRRIRLKKIYHAIRDARCVYKTIFLDSENITMS